MDTLVNYTCEGFIKLTPALQTPVSPSQSVAYSQPVIQSMAQSVILSASQVPSYTVSQSISCSISYSFCRSGTQLHSQSVSQLVNQSFCQPARYPIAQSINCSISHSVSGSGTQLHSQSVSCSISHSVSQSGTQLHSQPVSQLLDQSVSWYCKLLNQSITQSVIYNQAFNQPVSQLQADKGGLYYHLPVMYCAQTILSMAKPHCMTHFKVLPHGKHKGTREIHEIIQYILCINCINHTIEFHKIVTDALFRPKILLTIEILHRDCLTAFK